MVGPIAFSRPVFLHAFREVYSVVTLDTTPGMAAIASDFGHILIGSVAAMIAAIFRITGDAASAHLVSAFPFVRHIEFLL